MMKAESRRWSEKIEGRRGTSSYQLPPTRSSVPGLMTDIDDAQPEGLLGMLKARTFVAVKLFFRFSATTKVTM